MTWTQEITNVSAFGGWEIYVSQSENGTYSLFQKVPFITEVQIYKYTKEITIPADQTTVLWFKALAFNKDGGKSGFSNKSKFVVSP